MKRLEYFTQLQKGLSRLDESDFMKWFAKNRSQPLNNPNDTIKQFRSDRGY